MSKNKYPIEVRLIYSEGYNSCVRVYAHANARYTKTLCIVSVSSVKILQRYGEGSGNDCIIAALVDPAVEGEIRFTRRGNCLRGPDQSPVRSFSGRWRVEGRMDEVGPMCSPQEDIEQHMQAMRRYREENFSVHIQNMCIRDDTAPDAKLLYITHNGRQGTSVSLTRQEMIKVRDVLNRELAS